ANYQRIDQDLDDVTNQRDARDAQIVQLQQDVNYFRQQNNALQNHVNQLTLEHNNSQNDLALMTTAYYNEWEERRHWWRVAKQLEKGMQMRINTLLLDKLALNFKLWRCQRHEDRRLPILKLMAPALAKFQPYIGREPPDEYMDRVIQSWAYLEGHMTVSVANIPPVFSQLETDSRQLQNKLHSDNDSIRAEIKSMIKSELALVPTPPHQMEPGKIYRDPHLRLNDQEWLRMDDATDRLSALAGPSYLQTFMDTISKEVMDRITPFLPNKKNNTPNNDDMDEITKGMSELSINKAIAKGISQGIKAVHDNNVSSRHRCSNCYSLGHNSRKCPYPRKRNRKNRKSRSKKRGSVNKSGSKKRQSLESPIQRSSQKIQKKSGTIIDSQIRKIILAMFNDPE
ncbi:10792_t:CDS:2, partial [Entrophospora sp. SA101]